MKGHQDLNATQKDYQNPFKTRQEGHQNPFKKYQVLREDYIAHFLILITQLGTLLSQDFKKAWCL